MKILITGVVGSGKSTIIKELRKRGYHAYDGDIVKGLTRWEDGNGQPVVDKPKPKPKGWFDNHYWNWNEQLLRELLNKSKLIFIGGIASNQKKFYSLFDKTILLTLDANTLTLRVKSRKTNSFGKDKNELSHIQSWHKPFEDDLKKMGVVSIDGNLPLNVIIARILKEANEA